MPKMRFETIVIDPPWQVGSLAHTGRKGHHIKPMKDNYEMMSLEEIKELPISDISTDNAYLFLWTTHTYLPHAFDILSHWGFKYHLTITWDKGRSIVHFGFHRKSEFVLFGYNGKLLIDPKGKSIATVLYEYNKGHSIKPDIFYQEIERKFPAPRLDIFARRKRQGWASWGNEVQSDVDLTASNQRLHTDRATPGVGEA